VYVQRNGRAVRLQCSTNASIWVDEVVRAGEGAVAQDPAGRIEKNISTSLSHEACLGVKTNCQRMLVEPPLDGLGLAGREVVADGDDRRPAGISASSWSRKPMKSHWLRVLGGHGRDLARVHGKGGEQVHRSIFLQAPQVLRADY
jgi:hypothetical protein